MNNPFIQLMLLIGTVTRRYRGSCDVGIEQPDRLFHQYIVGQTGTGKSTLLMNMVKQDVAAGRGFCLIDPHGDLTEAVEPLLGEDAIYWNPADPICPYGYNPLTYVQEKYRPLVASGIIETLKQQWSEAWGVRMEHLLRFSLMALLSRPGSSFADIVPMFTKKRFRNEILNHVTDDEVLKFWKSEFPNMNYKGAVDGVAPIANKLGAFLSHPQIRKALCEPAQPLRFRKLMDEGTPLVVNLAKGKLGADITNVLGGLIVSSIGNAAYTRTDVPEQLRRPYFLYADEFHAFTTEAFAGMLSELRKYKLGLVLAHQYVAQLSAKVFESIMGNVGTVMVFRVGAKDAPVLSKQLGHLSTKSEHLISADLTELPNFNAYVRLMIGGKKSKVFSIRTTLPNIGKQDDRN